MSHSPPTPPYLYPYYPLTKSGSILIPSSLMLLVSFHPRCPHPALILSFAWTNWTACLWSPACDLQTATPIVTCAHTHMLYIIPLPIRALCPTHSVWFSRTTALHTHLLFLGCALLCPPGQTGLGSAGPGLPFCSCSSAFSATGFPAPLQG